MTASDSSTRALIFDLGKVLIDFSVERACTQIATLVETKSDEIKSFIFDDGLEFRFERGEIDFNFLHQTIETRYQKKISGTQLRHAASDIFEPINSSLDLLSKIREKYAHKTPFILLSNTNEIHWEHIEKSWNISQWFDKTVLSFEVRAMKPDPRIYQEALRMAGSPAHQCFFVDDVPENVAAACREGLDAVVFEGSEKLTHDLKKRGFYV